MVYEDSKKLFYFLKLIFSIKLKMLPSYNTTIAQ